MEEYISKHEAYTMMKDLEAAYIYPPVKEAYGTAARRIDQMPSADVQPVNQWISVKDRLPENTKPCAVVTEDNGLGVSRYMGRNRFEWTLFGELVLYWMSLPEPPEGGDTSE